MFRLCNDDELLKILKETFKANPIKIPEERIKPLIVFSGKNKRYKYIGEIENLLSDNNSINPELKDSKMANLSATKSKSIDTKLGLQVMSGFLQGFGANDISLDSVFEGVEKISFSFQKVNRKYVDVGKLCLELSKRKFNLEHPVNKRFLDEDETCIIVDSIITSNNFSIKIEEASKSDFKFNIPEIQKILSSSENKISSSSSSSLDISFEGEKSLAFAFTGFVLNCDEDGSIYYEGEADKMHLTSIPNVEYTIPPSIDLLDSEIGLLEIE
jgi:hypothetical protein